MTSGGTAAAAAAATTAASSSQNSFGEGGSSQGASNSTGDIPNQLAQLSEGWLELESDPGLFSSLICDFGVRGVQVEEIYDLERPFTEQQPVVYGFIFLFNVIEERRNRSRRDHLSSASSYGSGSGYGYGTAHADSNPSPSSLLTGDYILEESHGGIDDESRQQLLKQIFFAYQKVPNSCATHAILSVLMNCSQVDLGPMLRRLKEFTRDMSPESKGFAIGNMAELAVAHNSHAAPLSAHREQQSKQASNAVRISQRHSSSCEAFHFVSFLPINGRLIELDGLKEAPIDHGPITEDEPWTEKFRRLMRRRIEVTTNRQGGATEHDIRYNLMAVIPSRYEMARAQLETMQANRVAILKIIQILEFSSAAGGGVHLDHSYSQYGLLGQRRVEGHPLSGLVKPSEDAQKSSSAQISTLQRTALSPRKRTASGSEIDSTEKRKSSLLDWPDPHTLAKSPGAIRLAVDDDKLLSSFCDDSKGNFTLGYDFPRKDLKTSSSVTLEGTQQGQLTVIKVEETSSAHFENLPPKASTLTSEKSVQPIKSENDDEKDEDYDDDSTDTASNASSTYNHQFEDENNLTVVNDSRFFVCKFEQRPVAQTTVTEGEEKSSEAQVPPTKVPKVEEKDDELELNGKEVEVEPASKARKSKSNTTDLPPPTSLNPLTSKTPTISVTNSQEDPPKFIPSILEQIRALKAAYGTSSTLFSSDENVNSLPTSVADFETHLKPRILKDLLSLLNSLNRQIKACRRYFDEEEKKQLKYRLDDSRRVHDYDPFIISFLSMFFEQGLLDSVLEGELYQNSQPAASNFVEPVGTSKSSGDRHSKASEKPLVNGGNLKREASGKVNIPNGVALGPLAPIVNSYTPAELTNNSLALRQNFESALFFPVNFSVSSVITNATTTTSNSNAHNNTDQHSQGEKHQSHHTSKRIKKEEIEEEDDDDDEDWIDLPPSRNRHR